MTNLPTWAQSSEAIALLAAIKASNPAETLIHADHSNWGGNQYGYRGRDVSLLRQLHEAALVRAMAKDEALWLAGDKDACKSDRSEFGKVMRAKPDALIRAVLDGDIALPVEVLAPRAGRERRAA